MRKAKKVLLMSLALMMGALAAEAKDLSDWSRLRKVSNKQVYLSIKPAQWVNKDTGKPLSGFNSPFWAEGEVAMVFESSAVVKVYGLLGSPLRKYPYSMLGLTFLFGGSLDFLSDEKTGELLCAVTILDSSDLMVVMKDNSRWKRILTLGVAPPQKIVYQNKEARWEQKEGRWHILIGPDQVQPLNEEEKGDAQE